MSYFATDDHTKIYYEIKGEGKPLILIHGWSCTRQDYKGAVECLKGSFKCITYDHRGHGASDCPDKGYTVAQLARDLANLIDYLQLDKVTLAGHSMGGHVIWSYIEQFGCDKLDKTVIIDMSPKPVTDETWKYGVFGNYPVSQWVKDLEVIAQDPADFMWIQTRKIVPDVAALPEILRPFVAPALKGVNHGFPLLGLQNSMMLADFRESLKLVKVPTLYIIPSTPGYPMGSAEYVCNNVDAPSKITEVEGTHLVLVQNPAGVAEAIKVFLEEKI